MKLGIIGGGVVGRATARCFMEWADVRVYDVMPERRTHSLPDTLDSDLVFVCLPTPQKEGELAADTSAVDRFFRDHAGYKTNFVLRSTVPIGTTRRLREQYDLPNLVHSPEFLTSRCAVTDAQMPARNIVGCDKDSMCGLFLCEQYRLRFPGVPIHLMTSDESEAVKLFQNATGAVKVALFNEFYSLCEKLSLDWQRVREALLASGWIGTMHTQVPGPDGKFGFGGGCLPKDLANLIDCMERAGVDRVVCAGALTYRNDK